MSFFRPEAVGVLRRYAEPTVYVAIAAAFLWKGLTLIGAGAWIGLALLVPGALAVLAAVGAIGRSVASWRSARAGPGVVGIEEGRITYLGPHGGATVAIDSLVRIDIVTERASSFAHGARWELTDEEGQRMSIPAAAVNAEALLDVLGALPGFSNMTATLALGDWSDGRRQVWRRPVPESRRVQPLR